MKRLAVCLWRPSRIQSSATDVRVGLQGLEKDERALRVVQATPAMSLQGGERNGF
jgi:hypothetical protein